MAPSVIILCTVIALCVGGSQSLECYVCDGSDACSDGKLNLNALTKATGCNYCKKSKTSLDVWIASAETVQRSCEETCQERSILLTNEFCCQDELCNSATKNYMTLGIMLVTLLKLLF